MYIPAIMLSLFLAHLSLIFHMTQNWNLRAAHLWKLLKYLLWNSGLPPVPKGGSRNELILRNFVWPLQKKATYNVAEGAAIHNALLSILHQFLVYAACYIRIPHCLMCTWGGDLLCVAWLHNPVDKRWFHLWKRKNAHSPETPCPLTPVDSHLWFPDSHRLMSTLILSPLLWCG